MNREPESRPPIASPTEEVRETKQDPEQKRRWFQAVLLALALFLLFLIAVMTISGGRITTNFYTREPYFNPIR